MKKNTTKNNQSTPFVLIAQANLRNQTQASAELAMYLNLAMANYELGSPNNNLKEKQNLNKRQRKRARRAERAKARDEASKIPSTTQTAPMDRAGREDNILNSSGTDSQETQVNSQVTPSLLRNPNIFLQENGQGGELSFTDTEMETEDGQREVYTRGSVNLNLDGEAGEAGGASSETQTASENDLFNREPDTQNGQRESSEELTFPLPDRVDGRNQPNLNGENSPETQTASETEFHNREPDGQGDSSEEPTYVLSRRVRSQIYDNLDLGSSEDKNESVPIGRGQVEDAQVIGNDERVTQISGLSRRERSRIYDNLDLYSNDSSSDFAGRGSRGVTPTQAYKLCPTPTDSDETVSLPTPGRVESLGEQTEVPSPSSQELYSPDTDEREFDRLFAQYDARPDTRGKPPPPPRRSARLMGKKQKGPSKAPGTRKPVNKKKLKTRHRRHLLGDTDSEQSSGSSLPSNGENMNNRDRDYVKILDISSPDPNHGQDDGKEGSENSLEELRNWVRKRIDKITSGNHKESIATKWFKKNGSSLSSNEWSPPIDRYSTNLVDSVRLTKSRLERLRKRPCPMPSNSSSSESRQDWEPFEIVGQITPCAESDLINSDCTECTDLQEISYDGAMLDQHQNQGHGDEAANLSPYLPFYDVDPHDPDPWLMTREYHERQMQNDLDSDSEAEDVMGPIMDNTMDPEEEDKLFNENLDKFLKKSGAKNKKPQETGGKGKAPRGFIVGLHEFNWNPHTKVAAHLKGHKLHCDKSAHPKPRAAIFASNNLNVWGVPHYTNRDMATVVWLVDNQPFKKVYITSTYHMDTTNKPQGEKLPVISPVLQNLINHCKREKSELIILADTNSHSVMWNMPESNPRGKTFERFIVKNNLKVLNTGPLEHSWTWSGLRGGERRFTIIDVAFCSPGISEFVTGWRVRNAAPISDHRSTEFAIKLSGCSTIRKRNFSQADWQVFLDYMEDKQALKRKPLWNQEDIEREVAIWYKDMYTALDLACPARNQAVRIPDIPWWNKELEYLRKKAKQIENGRRYNRKHPDRRQRRNCSEEDSKEAWRVYNRACKKAKRKSWQDFVKGCDSLQKVAALSRILKSKVNEEVSLMRTVDGEMCTPEDSLDLLCNTHFPGNKAYPRAEGRLIPGDRYANIESEKVAFITPEKVKTAFSMFQPFKSPGTDNIPPIVLQNLGENAIERITKIYKACISLGSLPERWLEVKVVFLPKPGKDDYAVPRSYRPISLMQFVMKGLERITLWDIEENALKTNPMHKNQHGFRKNYSVDTALSHVAEDIEYAFQRKKCVLLVNLDIKGAYDNLTNKDIIESLKRIGASDEYIKWHKFFLDHRKIIATHKGIQQIKFPRKGTPQGSICSPAHWNIVSDTLHELFDTGRVKSVGYADDTTLYVEGDDPEQLRAIMQTEGLVKVQQWATDHKMEFCLTKTKAMLFTEFPDRHEVPDPLRMYGKTLEYTNKLKALGVYLDPKLDWRPHIIEKTKQCKKTLGRFHGAQGKIWGLQPRMALWAYTGIVRPAVTHACMIWAGATRYIGVQNKLRSFQLLALRLLGFTRRSTPARGLELISNTMPLHLHIQQLAANAHIRTLSKAKYSSKELFTKKVTYKGHRQFIREKLKELGLESTDVKTDRIGKTRIWKRLYQVDWDSLDPVKRESGKPVLDLEQLRKRDDIPGGSREEDLKAWEIYCDGSRDEQLGLAGAGVTAYQEGIPKFEGSFGLGDRTVFQSEVYAIRKGALWLLDPTKRHLLKDRVVRFYTDSQAAIKAIGGFEIKSSLVWSTITLLNEAVKWSGAKSINIRWVKAHVGHEGNERADLLAKEALAKPIAGDQPPIAEVLIKSKIATLFQAKWKTEWDEYAPEGRQTRHFFPHGPRPKFAHEVLNSGRPAYSTLCQLITGHNYMNRHQHIIDVANRRQGDGPDCTLCNEGPMSSQHILGECAALNSIRQKHFQQLQLEPPFNNLAKSALVGFCREAPITELRFFIEQD